MSLLSDYLSDVFGNLETVLGWDSSSYNIIISETLDRLNLSVEPNPLTKQIKLVGKVELFKRAWQQTAGEFSFSADGAKYDRNQIHEMIADLYQDALEEAVDYLDEFSITVASFSE